MLKARRMQSGNPLQHTQMLKMTRGKKRIILKTGQLMPGGP
ncbi:hypothetical protein AC26_0428 [Escherichia coli 1-176-05_S3_C2]|nr:hypothetical protein AC26_0428 [Escherichia coli 1-176-05_S3_C2]